MPPPRPQARHKRRLSAAAPAVPPRSGRPARPPRPAGRRIFPRGTIGLRPLRGGGWHGRRRRFHRPCASARPPAGTKRPYTAPSAGYRTAWSKARPFPWRTRAAILKIPPAAARRPAKTARPKAPKAIVRRRARAIRCPLPRASIPRRDGACSSDGFRARRRRPNAFDTAASCAQSGILSLNKKIGNRRPFRSCHRPKGCAYSRSAAARPSSSRITQSSSRRARSSCPRRSAR